MRRGSNFGFSAKSSKLLGLQGSGLYGLFWGLTILLFGVYGGAFGWVFGGLVI